MGRNAKFPEVALRGTQLRRLASSIVEQEYHIHISLPKDYETSDKTYPVMYVLDSDIIFGLAIQDYWGLEFADEIQRIIIVGIGGYGRRDEEIFYGRSRDYTPSEMSREEVRELYGDLANILPVSGGAAHFLDFIQKELCPFIESHYRTDPAERCLLGASLGGLFCMYALFSTAEFFNRYIIGSPALFWDNCIIFDQEEAFAEEHKSLPVHIYTAMGALEGKAHIQYWQDMMNTLQGRYYDGLRINANLFDGETHVSVVPIIFTRGMKAVFPP